MANKKEDVSVKHLKRELKHIFDEEIKNLPDLLKELSPKERTNFLLKLMPYVMPKVETEPFNFENQTHINI